MNSDDDEPVNLPDWLLSETASEAFGDDESSYILSFVTGERRETAADRRNITIAWIVSRLRFTYTDNGFDLRWLRDVVLRFTPTDELDTILGYSDAEWEQWLAERRRGCRKMIVFAVGEEEARRCFGPNRDH